MTESKTTKPNSAGERQPVNEQQQYQEMPKTEESVPGAKGARKIVRDYERRFGEIKPETISLPDETIPRSVGAKWANHEIRMPDGSSAHFVEGTKLRNKEVFAGKGTKTPIRDVERLVKTYGGKAENWQKVKGEATLEQNGKSFDAEIHWYDEHDAGKVDIKFKRYL